MIRPLETRQMRINTTILGIAAALGLTLAVTQFMDGPRQAVAAVDTDGSRWSDAFGDGRPGPVLPAGVKGDRLAFSAAPRGVTQEYRVGENTSVLVRAPLTQVAER